MDTIKITKVNVYRGTDGVWYGARWAGAEYDGCDTLDCAQDASEEEALAAAALEWNAAEIRRVNDV